MEDPVQAIDQAAFLLEIPVDRPDNAMAPQLCMDLFLAATQKSVVNTTDSKAPEVDGQKTPLACHNGFKPLQPRHRQTLPSEKLVPHADANNLRSPPGTSPQVSTFN